MVRAVGWGDPLLDHVLSPSSSFLYCSLELMGGSGRFCCLYTRFFTCLCLVWFSDSCSFSPLLSSREDGFLRGEGQLFPVRASVAWVAISVAVLSRMVNKIFLFLLTAKIYSVSVH